LRDVRLDKHGAPFRVQTGGKPIEKDVKRVFFYPGSIGIIGRERVPVGNEEETFVLALHADPILQGSDKIAQMKFARGSHAANDAFSLIGWG
jgi:hypothetical protein